MCARVSSVRGAENLRLKCATCANEMAQFRGELRRGSARSCGAMIVSISKAECESRADTGPTSGGMFVREVEGALHRKRALSNSKTGLRQRNRQKSHILRATRATTPPRVGGTASARPQRVGISTESTWHKARKISVHQDRPSARGVEGLRPVAAYGCELVAPLNPSGGRSNFAGSNNVAAPVASRRASATRTAETAALESVVAAPVASMSA